ncbi:MAG: 1-deoxy-D-xylulose-5-phosphate synthase [Prevotellaceae bacterium]|jgi:1-deoxy-D-xylulose-5-phosphate synthase|nr:1-deoxy-D-xylulose-5-phosphate synthase [Prevotellaceae bacterium]
MPLLEQIQTPSDLKTLSVDQLKALCQELRTYIIDCCALNPGHLGSSLGTVELSVALHYVFDTPKDKLIWDVGHQTYAHKIITGRREAFKTKRTYGGISGFPKINESLYDSFGTGHASTSISAALGMAVAAELDGSDEQIVAVIGDGALTGGLAFEGLNNAGARRTNMLVIVNDNQISIDASVGAIHNYLIKLTISKRYNRFKQIIWNFFGATGLRWLIQKFVATTKSAFFGKSTLFASMGFRYFGVIDGHNLQQLIQILRRLREIKGPKLLHIRTVKGKGYQPAEKDQSIWHAPGTYNIETGERNDTQRGPYHDRYQDVFGATLLELAKDNKKIIGITPAMPTGSSLNIMMESIPERAFDVGIAEAHAVTFSAGLAARGYLPYCCIYSSFMQRAYDSVIHDVALQNLKVVLCLDRGGIVGEDGPTHHGVFDLAYIRPIPGLMIAAPRNKSALRNLLYSAQNPDYSAITIRYPRGEGTHIDWQQPFSYIPPATAELLHQGSDIAVLTLGWPGDVALEVALNLEKEGIGVQLWDMRFLKPLDSDVLHQIILHYNKIVTIEDGTLIGGLYGAISEYIASVAPHITLHGIGLPDRFIEQGSLQELYSAYGLTKESICKMIKKLLD